MPSSVIRRVDYDAESRTLTIRFVSGEDYAYYEVPPATAEAFRSAFSKGSFFQARIRDAYAFARITDGVAGSLRRTGEPD